MSLNTTEEINRADCETISRYKVPVIFEVQATNVIEAQLSVTGVVDVGLASLARIGGEPHLRFEDWKFDQLHMDRWNIINVATAAANMMDGLLDGRKFTDIIEAWAMGFLELSQCLAEVAIYGEEQIMRLGPEQEFPGVYDYEVSHEFGRWFGEVLLEGGDYSLEACCKKLDELREAFFNQP